ncbi:MAG: BlaI/MecI/CopY family transcriptional regulator [Clostridia bacterium]|nr:BlaI/MecI/CopY family transcriptional regulator [Clostridia bacterium]
MKISDSEMEIMKILWSCGGEITSPEIAARLNDSRKPTTILTFLKRLEDKGAASIRREGKINYYSARISKDEYLHEQTEEFVNEIHNGSVKNFLAALYADGKPDKQELNKIKEWFESL